MEEGTELQGLWRVSICMKMIHNSCIDSIWSVVNDMQVHMEDQGISSEVADLIIARGIELLLETSEPADES